MLSRKIIIPTFIAIQLVLIFFYIYTQSTIIQLTYSFQDADRRLQELHKKKSDLTHELLQAQDVQLLKNYAVKELHMKKARLSDIQELPLDHE